MNTTPFDLTIIGSGPGGYRAAVLATLRGQKVAIIERATWGGTCLNRGCVPKKDWHETAKWIEQSRHFHQRGVIGGPLGGDMDQAWLHQREVVDTVRTSYTDYLKRLGVQMFSGHGRFRDAHHIRISGATGIEELSTRHSVIATGSAPLLPDSIATVPGRVLTSDMLFDDGVPAGQRVLLVGGGVIGTEFAYIFSMLGKAVSWVVHSPALAHTFYSSQAKDTLRDALEALDIHPRAGFQLARMEAVGAGVTAFGSDGTTLEADWALLATGRKPFTDDLGLENTAVTRGGNGFVQVNDHLETAEAGIYAIGDVIGPLMNANQALADATLVVNNIVSASPKSRNSLWVPELVYSAVELARIGMNDDQAEDEGFEPAVGFAAFETSPRALGQDDTRGFVRLLADMDSGALLGGEVVGREAGELIHLLSLSADREHFLRQLAQARFNHPARAEELLNATETLAARWGLQAQIFGED